MIRTDSSGPNGIHNRTNRPNCLQWSTTIRRRSVTVHNLSHDEKIRHTTKQRSRNNEKTYLNRCYKVLSFGIVTNYTARNVHRVYRLYMLKKINSNKHGRMNTKSKKHLCRTPKDGTQKPYMKHRVLATTYDNGPTKEHNKEYALLLIKLTRPMGTSTPTLWTIWDSSTTRPDRWTWSTDWAC